MAFTSSDFNLGPGNTSPTRAEINKVFQTFYREFNVDPGQVGAEFDVINEATSGAGVTVDSVKMLDGNIILGSANPSIFGNDTDGVMSVSGGATAILGANIKMYGDTHGSKADDFEVYGSAVLQLLYDDSGSLWDFQANAITTTGVISGAAITGTGAFDAQANVRFSGTEDIEPGGTTTALSLVLSQHMIGADVGGDIFTLANGSVGDIHTIALDDAAGTATITPATFNGGTSITFDALGDSVTLQWFATIGWTIIGGNSYAII